MARTKSRTAQLTYVTTADFETIEGSAVETEGVNVFSYLVTTDGPCQVRGLLSNLLSGDGPTAYSDEVETSMVSLPEAGSYNVFLPWLGDRCQLQAKSGGGAEVVVSGRALPTSDAAQSLEFVIFAINVAKPTGRPAVEFLITTPPANADETCEVEVEGVTVTFTAVTGSETALEVLTSLATDLLAELATLTAADVEGIFLDADTPALVVVWTAGATPVYTITAETEIVLTGASTSY